MQRLKTWKNTITGEIVRDTLDPLGKVKSGKPVEYRAKQTGTCFKCSRPITIGDLIQWDKTKEHKRYHTNCADPKNSAWIELETTTHTCETCGAVFPDVDLLAKHLANHIETMHVKTMRKAPAPSPMPASQFDGDEQYKMEVPDDDAPAFEHRPTPKPSNGSYGLLELISERVEQ